MSLPLTPYAGVEHAYAAFQGVRDTWAALVPNPGAEATLTATIHFGDTALELFAWDRVEHRESRFASILHNLVMPIMPSTRMPPEQHNLDLPPLDNAEAEAMTAWLTSWGAETDLHLPPMATAPFARVVEGSIASTLIQEFARLDITSGEVYEEWAYIHPREPDSDPADPDREHRWRRVPDDLRAAFQVPKGPRVDNRTHLECCLDSGLVKMTTEPKPPPIINYWQAPPAAHKQLLALEAVDGTDLPDPDLFLVLTSDDPLAPPRVFNKDIVPETKQPHMGVKAAIRALTEALAPDGGLPSGVDFKAVVKARDNPLPLAVLAIGGRDITDEVHVAPFHDAIDAPRYAWQPSAAVERLRLPVHKEDATSIEGMVLGLGEALLRQERGSPEAVVEQRLDEVFGADGLLLYDLHTGEMLRPPPSLVTLSNLLGETEVREPVAGPM